MTESDLINLGNRVIDECGNVVYFNEALIEMLYNDNIPNEILFSEKDCDVKAFNKLSYENFDDVYFKLPTKIQSIDDRKNDWFYPHEYDNLNLEEYFNNILNERGINTFEIKNRVIEELRLYKEKDMEKFLRFCIYLSDIISTNNLTVGVGRGSSVASYLLYLIKIHLIDSIKYKLDIKEFLK